MMMVLLQDHQKEDKVYIKRFPYSSSMSIFYSYLFLLL